MPKQKSQPLFLASAEKVPGIWHDPIYRIDFALHVGSFESVQRWCEKSIGRKLDAPDAPEASARTSWVPDFGLMIFWIDPECKESKPSWMSIFAHEAEHATHFIMQHIGLEHCLGSDEAYAYYLGWLMGILASNVTLVPVKASK